MVGSTEGSKDGLVAETAVVDPTGATDVGFGVAMAARAGTEGVVMGEVGRDAAESEGEAARFEALELARDRDRSELARERDRMVETSVAEMPRCSTDEPIEDTVVVVVSGRVVMEAVLVSSGLDDDSSCPTSPSSMLYSRPGLRPYCVTAER